VQEVDPLGLVNLFDIIWVDEIEGTTSIDLTGSLDIVTLGGNAGFGVAFSKKKGDWISDICFYLAACGHMGSGGNVGAVLTVTTSGAQPSTGVGRSGGIGASGGAFGRFGIAIQDDLDNPGSPLTSASIGVGAGYYSGSLVCQTPQICLVN